MTDIVNFEFIWHVTDDDKDYDSEELVKIIRNDSYVAAQWDSGTNGRWADNTTHSAIVGTVDPIDRNTINTYTVELSHTPVGNDGFRFNFELKGFNDKNKCIYVNYWSGIHLGDKGRNVVTSTTLNL
jgi:hypothetical protein